MAAVDACENARSHTSLNISAHLYMASLLAFTGLQTWAEPTRGMYVYSKLITAVIAVCNAYLQQQRHGMAPAYQSLSSHDLDGTE